MERFLHSVVESAFLFSFGVSKRKNQETGQLTGYSIPVCLWKKDEKPNQEEQNFFNVLTTIHDICRSYLEKGRTLELTKSVSHNHGYIFRGFAVCLIFITRPKKSHYFLQNL